MNNIYITPVEALTIQMGLALMVEKFNQCNHLPWNPESRKDQRDILATINSISKKIEKHTGIKAELPPYEDGEEVNFFTKES